MSRPHAELAAIDVARQQSRQQPELLEVSIGEERFEFLRGQLMTYVNARYYKRTLEMEQEDRR